ncbi:MAG: ZIP family metal transporter [Lachnospiraceae bacterium]|nr:ZIP family metal transporter [Lachnospiraceae bacterium]
MTIYLLTGLLLPFAGTTLGAACVFFLKNELKAGVQKTLLGFASGVMVAASVWSLLIPSMEMSESMGRLSFIPALTGLLAGFGFLLLMDIAIPHLHLDSDQAEGPKCKLPRTTMLLLAVTLHNIPEGMAVGVVFAGVLSGEAQITSAGALALAIGIAIQNFPEGAVISLPLRGGMSSSEAQSGGQQTGECSERTDSAGELSDVSKDTRGAGTMSRPKAFLCGMLSGIVEPVGAVITILLSRIVMPMLPYLLSFAAGAMLYVVVEELIPESSTGEHSNLGTIGFAAGFALMMVLDVALG